MRATMLVLILATLVGGCGASMDNAKRHYVQIVVNNPEGVATDRGTGLATQHGVLTCAHMFGFAVTDGTRRGFISKFDTKQDLMLVQFSSATKEGVEWADPEVGQHFILYSNAYGFNGAFTSHHVFAITQDGILFIPAPHPGQSGAGMFLDDGKVIGIARALIQLDTGRVFGLGIPKDTIIKFLETTNGKKKKAL